jgi:diguanylate cyclase (GGDEF)-like protein
MPRWNYLQDSVRTSISGRLYGIAFVSIAAVLTLVFASVYFANTTKDAAEALFHRGFVGTFNAARLELLLEQHRRLVESMPSEVSRERLAKGRAELSSIKAQLEGLVDLITARAPKASSDVLETRIAARLPELFEMAEKVTFYASEFAQDKAIEGANVYANVADSVQVYVKAYREQRLRDSQELIAYVIDTAGSLTIWVLIAGFAAVLFIGPIGLATTRSVLARVRQITQAMVLLARQETGTQVPSRHDRDEVGEMARAVEVFKQNAIQLADREQELKQLHSRIDSALNNMTHGVCMFDADHKLIVCNETYAEMYDLPAELTLPGTALKRMDNYRAASGNGALMNLEQMAAAAMTQSTQKRTAFTQELMDGRCIAVSQRPMSDGGWVAVHEDITERRRSEAKIAHLARHDLLTNLPNRVLLREHLESMLANMHRDGGFGVYCLDLDNFKKVNDAFGHSIGDELLKVVSGRLLTAVGNTAMVARIGGDEFAIVESGVAGPEQCSELASRIVQSIGQPYDIDGRHVVIGTSIGIAIAPGDGVEPDQLLRNADMALYLAKGDGRGTHRFFEREMDRRVQARRALEADLRVAIANAEFELHYQPIIRLQRGEVKGFEALIRWNHRERGWIPPAQFIPLAEETGLIVPLGEWVMRTACIQAAKWEEPFSVAVNLSPKQFKGTTVVDQVVGALAVSGLEPQRLDVEITESVLLQDEATTLATLHKLRELGVRVSMDDFGTGYSSLAYLRSFPFDKIKIDRSFVSDMLARQDCRAIVRAVAGLARSLNICTIVEGIESKEQLEMARHERCDEGQGYYFSPPIPESEIPAFLTRHRHEFVRASANRQGRNVVSIGRR